MCMQFLTERSFAFLERLNFVFCGLCCGISCALDCVFGAGCAISCGISYALDCVFLVELVVLFLVLQIVLFVRTRAVFFCFVVVFCGVQNHEEKHEKKHNFPVVGRGPGDAFQLCSLIVLKICPFKKLPGSEIHNGPEDREIDKSYGPNVEKEPKKLKIHNVLSTSNHFKAHHHPIPKPSAKFQREIH